MVFRNRKYWIIGGTAALLLTVTLLFAGRHIQGAMSRVGLLNRDATDRVTNNYRRMMVVLDRSHPDMRTILETENEEGFHAAIEQTRQWHRQLPEPPVLPHGLLRTSPEQIVKTAEGIMNEGWRIGRRPPYPVKTPIDWAADPHQDRGWRMWLNAWRVLEPIFEAYDQTHDLRYLDFANKIALDWIDQHQGVETENPFAWYDMAIGRRALLLGKLIDANLRVERLKDERLYDLFLAARRHAAELYDEDKIMWHSNHGIYQLAGLLSLSKTVPELKDAEELRIFANWGLRKLFQEHFNREGMHREHSPFYHVALVNKLGLLIEHELVDDPQLISLFRNANRNIAWFCHPNGYLSRMGDGDRTLAAERIIFRDDPQVQFFLSQGEQGTQPQSASRVFTESGYAVFRGAWDHRPWEETSYLFFSAAFHSRTHKHADDFTFEWSEAGRNLIIDSGRYSYKYDDPNRQYIESTRAHNTVEIDGRDYSRFRNDAFGSAITGGGEAEGAYYVEAEVDRERFFQTKHKRVLVYQPGRWLVVIDQLTSPEEHEFAQCFHFDPELEFQQVSGGAFAADLPECEKTLSVTSLGSECEVIPHLIKGQTEPRLQGWTSFTPNKLIPNAAIELRTSGKQALYVTLFTLAERGMSVTPGSAAYDEETGDWWVRWELEGTPQGFDYSPSRKAAPLRLIRDAKVASKSLPRN